MVTILVTTKYNTLSIKLYTVANQRLIHRFMHYKAPTLMYRSNENRQGTTGVTEVFIQRLAVFISFQLITKLPTLIVVSQAFMEPECSLQCSQEPANGPHLSQLSPVHTSTHCPFVVHINVILRSPPPPAQQAAPSLQPCMHCHLSVSVTHAGSPCFVLTTFSDKFNYDLLATSLRLPSLW
jgi:hypothetical protein